MHGQASDLSLTRELDLGINLIEILIDVLQDYIFYLLHQGVSSCHVPLCENWSLQYNYLLPRLLNSYRLWLMSGVSPGVNHGLVLEKHSM